jgi:hypothetical protein
MTETKNLWWGYLHTQGTLQAKRYFGPLDIQEAEESPFCAKVVGPFEATDREEALKIVEEQTHDRA